MRAYYALVHKDPGSAFGISFPDLPQVFSAADDEADLVGNAIEALRLWGETEPLPEPTSIDHLAARDDLRIELAQGAFFVRIPLIEADTRVVRVNVTFEAGTLRAIDIAAKERELTRAAFLAQAARHEIENAG